MWPNKNCPQHLAAEQPSCSMPFKSPRGKTLKKTTHSLSLNNTAQREQEFPTPSVKFLIRESKCPNTGHQELFFGFVLFFFRQVQNPASLKCSDCNLCTPLHPTETSKAASPSWSLFLLNPTWTQMLITGTSISFLLASPASTTNPITGSRYLHNVREKSSHHETLERASFQISADFQYHLYPIVLLPLVNQLSHGP